VVGKYIDVLCESFFAGHACSRLLSGSFGAQGAAGIGTGASAGVQIGLLVFQL
jgi:hypothetical protein